MDDPNPINSLIQNINAYLLEKNSNREKGDSKADELKGLVKVHHEKLKEFGDISIPTSHHIWQNCLLNTPYKLRDNIFKDESAAGLLATSAAWPFPVVNLVVEKERWSLFLKRDVVIAKLLEYILEPTNANTYGHMKKNSLRSIKIHEMVANYDDTNLSLYRAKLLENTLKKVLSYSEYILKTASDNDDDMGSDCLHLFVHSLAEKGTSADAQDEAQSHHCKILQCGIVSDPETGKLVKMETPDYISLRAKDMRLMVMHKYGMRAKNDQRFRDLIEQLGNAAVTVDLLEVKHSSPARIIRNGQGSTKGASFILYNSARLEVLLRTFNERVEQRIYPPLPDINDVDLTLLKEEEEWQLLYGFIFAFPNAIEYWVQQMVNGLCATHSIIRFLNQFVSVFSIYYRRIRILTETRDQLMPYVYARIYLIKAIRQILYKTLSLLDIEPVLFM